MTARRLPPSRALARPSLPLTAALLAAGAPGPRRVACLVLAAGHALSVWLIGRDAWPGAGAGAPDALELARLLLVALALWYCALEDRHARASAAPTPVQPPAAAVIRPRTSCAWQNWPAPWTRSAR